MAKVSSVWSLIFVSLLLSASLQQTLTPLRARVAHLQVDCFNSRADWAGLKKGVNGQVRVGGRFGAYNRAVQEVNGHKCKGDDYCNTGNKCSKWGWCQGSTYSGDLYEGCDGLGY